MDVQQQYSGDIHMIEGGTIGVRIDNYHAGGAAKTIFEILEPHINPHAAYNSKEREDEQASICLQSTRERVLSDLTSWAQTDADKPVCWLYGPAGAGKSTIATTIAAKFDGNTQGTRLAFSWFFSRRNSNRSDLVKFFPTFAHCLARILPAIEKPMLQALKDRNILHSGLQDQYVKLIEEPIRSLNSHIQPMLIIIDGLDEHINKDGEGEGSDIRTLIALLVSNLSRPPFRILFASRPEHHICSVFTGVWVRPKARLVALQDYNSLAEIENYLRSEFGQVAIKFGLPQPWPSESDIKKLAKKSEGIFIYASTVIKFVGDNQYENPRQKFVKIMDAHIGLDSLFTQVLDNAVKYSDFDGVFGVLIFLRNQLNISDLAFLTQLDSWDLRFALRGCPSILLIPENDHDYVRPYHASLLDFLTDPLRAHHHHLDPVKYHQSIFKHCIESISVHLNDKGNWSSSLRYPYKNWCYHLSSIVPKVTNLMCTETFLSDLAEHILPSLVQLWMNWIPKLESHEPVALLKKDVETICTMIEGTHDRMAQLITLYPSINYVLVFLNKFLTAVCMLNYML